MTGIIKSVGGGLKMSCTFQCLACLACIGMWQVVMTQEKMLILVTELDLALF